MKSLLAVLFLLTLTALPLRAQTNAPARLALVSENDPAASAVDVLTAQLSGNARVQLLERDQIVKVFHELSLSAANTDYLKLGRMLEADGLLLVQSTMEGTTQYLNLRLVAVQPGVVLLAEKVSWPVPNPAEWAAALAGHLEPFLPKLKVLIKDAIPLSLVNLRSAVSSVEARETERELKVLAIQRLSREPQLFVLERQKMALLGEEKSLNADDSAFWNGNWLLEGVVDQNGYSPDTITIDARLTPPKGAAPVPFTVSGSRTNLPEVINQLALQVAATLQINAPVKEWQAAAEARQYFDEAQWALRWGVYSEAQSAADAAWALGRHDLDCAQLRVQTYMISPNAGKMVIEYPPTEAPDPQIIADATHALELYNELGLNLPPDEPKVDSAWYRLGLNDLTVAAQVLQVYNWSPDFYTPVAEKLADLRAAARATAAWISRSPSVHDSYYLGDQVVVYDNLRHFEESPSIFSVKLDCASLWQERPEDTLAVYRELLASPVFCYFHDRIWFRDNNQGGALRVLPPRLVAWHAADQPRIPVLWKGFVQELKTSTNLLWQMEGGALELADINDGAIMGPVFTNFFSTLFAHRAELVAIPAEILYLDWHLSGLVEHGGSWTNEKAMEALQQIYQQEYVPQLEAMDREYQNKTVAGAKNNADFVAQKQYLAANKPYDFFEFVTQFQSRDYSKGEALEIQPLIATYQSNLAAQVQTATGVHKARLQGGLAQVQFLAADVDRILNPPAPRSAPAVPAGLKVPGPALATASPSPPAIPATEMAKSKELMTNVIVASQFYPIPMDNLISIAAGERVAKDFSRITITAHQWQEGRLVLDFHYRVVIESFVGEQHLQDLRQAEGNAIALLDPATRHWEVMAAPEASFVTQNNSYHRTTLLGGEVYTSEGGQIQKYDRQNQHWQALPVSDGGNYELFAVAGNLYAANQSQIFEIAADGKSTRLLASNRRQPPTSPVDTEDLGNPFLFAGPDHSLRLTTKNKIYAWTADNWQVLCAAPPVSLAREFDEAGVLFVTDGWNLPGCVSRLLTAGNQVEYCLGQSDGPGRPAPAKFKWKWPTTMFLGDLPAALRKNDLYLLLDHAEGRDVLGEEQPGLTGKRMSAKNGYHAELLCYVRDLPSPLTVYLRFDNPEGCPPVTGQNPAVPFMPPALPPGWLEFTPGALLCGLENPDRLMPGAADKVDSHYKAGVWVLPLGPIDAALAPQIELQHQAEQVRKAQALAEAETAGKNRIASDAFQKAFLHKYDHNHNGVLDPAERAEARDDPDYSRYMINLLRIRQNNP